MEYDLAIKMNEVLIYSTTEMNLENIMSSEKKQTSKVTYYMLLFI